MAERSGWPWWGLIAASALAALAQLRAIPSPDVSWNLYAASRLAEGARLGVDLFENTPPMIYGIKIPLVVTADVLGVGHWSLWAVVVSVLAVLCLGLAIRLLPDHVELMRAKGLPGFALGVGALLFLPAVDFGQREHVTAILTLPYVALAARRLSGGAAPARAAVLAGLLGAIGIGIKPHFAVLPVALVLVELPRLGIRNTAKLPEHWSVILVGAVYVALVAALAPDWLAYARTFGPLYGHFLKLPLVAMLAYGYGMIPALVTLGVYAALRRHASPAWRPVLDAAAVAMAAFHLAGMLQGKGWRYHFLPSLVLMILLNSASAASAWRALPRLVDRIYLALGAGMVLGFAGYYAPDNALRLLKPGEPTRLLNPNFHALLPLARSVGPHGHVAILSSLIGSGFPLVPEAGARWTFRHPSLWPLVAFYEPEIGHRTLITGKPYAERTGLEREFGEHLIEDIERTRPALLLVLRHDPRIPGWGGARRFDYLAWFSGHRGFDERVMAHYRPIGQWGSYDAWWRLDAGIDPPPPAPVLVDPVEDRLRVQIAAVVLAVLGFAVGGLTAFRVSRGTR